jgi:hypothetical protein
MSEQPRETRTEASTEPTETSHEPTSRQIGDAGEASVSPELKAAGRRPGDSLRELREPGTNVGVTEEEEARRRAAVEAAAAEAERLRNEPGHHGREHL